MILKHNNMKEEKKFCPYCGSDKIQWNKLPSSVYVDPAPSFFDKVKNLFKKRYICENCGKKFN